MAGERTFIGPLDEKLQFYVDEQAAREDLKQFVPDRCKSCSHLGYIVIFGIARQVAEQKITLSDGAKQVVDYTANCSGSQTDATQFDAPAICPQKISEEKSWRTDCF